jgi:DNA polymerase-1
MNRLVLIDGNAVLHRAYHAIPPLTAPDGSVVNAVYGFATMLMRLNTDLRPTHMAVAFDRPKPTFRKEMFAGYQSKRPKMDEDLVGQIPKVHNLVVSFGIPIFEKDGFEADDVIGTLAGASKKDHIDQVIIVTGDRDILQLVEDDRVMVYMPTKGLSEAKLYREGDVKERLGVSPKNVPDFKGLAGDSSDNYPGVGGIGPKTAIALIEAFGSVEGVYKALKKHDKKLETFSASVLEKLKNGEKDALLYKDIATIRTNVELDAALNATSGVVLNTPEARKALEALHFHSLLKRLQGGEEKKPEPKKEKKEEKKPVGEQQALF